MEKGERKKKAETILKYSEKAVFVMFAYHLIT
jgi:hypothetical protein